MLQNQTTQMGGFPVYERQNVLWRHRRIYHNEVLQTSLQSAHEPLRGDPLYQNVLQTHLRITFTPSRVYIFIEQK